MCSMLREHEGRQGSRDRQGSCFRLWYSLKAGQKRRRKRRSSASSAFVLLFYYTYYVCEERLRKKSDLLKFFPFSLSPFSSLLFDFDVRVSSKKEKKEFLDCRPCVYMYTFVWATKAEIVLVRPSLVRRSKSWSSEAESEETIFTNTIITESGNTIIRPSWDSLQDVRNFP